MKITIQVLIEGADALPLTMPIQTIDRQSERIEEVGLQIVEAKSILREVGHDSRSRHADWSFAHDARSHPGCFRSSVPYIGADVFQ
jgi:hypothetical protein